MKKEKIFIFICLVLLSACSPSSLDGIVIEKAADGYKLSIDGRETYIKGVGGTYRLDIAAQSGANAFRTWGGNVEEIKKNLALASEHNMYVMQGIGMTKDSIRYYDDEYKNKMREEVRLLAETFKNDTSLLAWGIGNEIELGNANIAAAWNFVEELAQLASNDFSDEYKKKIDDLAYTKIAINSLTATNSSNEIGATVTASDIAWALNKEPKTQKIKFGAEQEEILDKALRKKSYTGKSLKTNTNIVLTVTDERDAVVSRTVGITFQPKVYWGKTNKEQLENADILALEGSSLAGGRGRTFTVNAGEGEKIVYAFPTSFGTPTFNVGGFDGGFKKARTLEFTNASGYKQSYDVWMSVNAGLGSTAVTVK